MCKKFIFILILIVSCKSLPCDTNTSFDNKFKKSIDVIFLSEKGIDTSIEDKLDAIRFLQSVTGIKSQIKDYEYPLYKNMTQFKEDKSKWERWYKKNRCNLSIYQLDSLYNCYLIYEL